MIIFSRSKKLTVDFITNDYKAYEYFSIDKSNKFIPRWWKDIPEEYQSDILKTKATNMTSLKRCPGFIDIFKHSYTMPLWTSCEIIVDDRISDCGYSAVCSDGSSITSHSSRESGTFMKSNSLIHFKFNSPWLGYSSKKRDLLWNWSPAMWNNPSLLNKLILPTAFRNFRGGTGTNIHSFMNSLEKDVLYLEAGVPMIHMTPMTDKKVEVKCHYDPEWFTKTHACLSDNFSFTNKYYTRKRHL